jgi:dihydrodipicolinate synthase/N-acetylneuraminate lyase
MTSSSTNSSLRREFLPGIVAIWKALQAGDEERAYQVYFPLCALVALQLQAGLDGFLAVEKYVLHKRRLSSTDIRRRPYNRELDAETQPEVDRLLIMLETEVGRD